MKRFVLYILLLLSLFGMTALSASAATYYVATTGVDTAGGTQATPWKTIQKAANTLVAGDTVYVRAGTYKEQVIPKNSGTFSGYITYSAYPGETVNVDGSNGFNGNTWAGIFDITSEDYIKIIGFHIVNSPSFGVHLYGANYVQILNNFTNNTSNSGIGTQESSNITIDGNDIGFMCLGGDQNNDTQEGISLEHTPNSIVSNNKVHDGGMEGIDLKVGSSNSKIFGNEVYKMPRNFIYVDAWDTPTTNIEIYDNTVHDTVYKTTGVNAGSVGISIGSERGSTVSSINVYNNIIYNVSGDGIMLADYHETGTPQPTFTNISIYNNTVYNTGTHVLNTWGGSGISLSNDFQGSIHTGIIIRNNILSKNPVSNISGASSGTTVSNNLFDGGSTSGTSAVVGDPKFVTAGSNFHLQSSSPAINAGVVISGLTTDFDGATRTGNPDIGAYEYVGTTGSYTITVTQGTNGTIAPGTTSVTSGSSQTFTITPNSGYQIASVMVDGTSVGASVSYTFTNVTAVHSITATFTATTDTEAPTVPTNLSATAISSSQINLTWTASTDNTAVKGYKIFRDGVQIGVQIGTATTNSYTDAGLMASTLYSYTVSAYDAVPNNSAQSTSASATTQASAAVNLAPSGVAYRWYNNSSATSNSNEVAAPGLNDNNLTTNVRLNTSAETSARYEAGGVIWSANKTISTVKFVNGTWASSNDGGFGANLTLQFTTNGTTWTNSGWTVTPAYAYDTAGVGGVTYTFTGGVPTSIRGFRISGQVHVSGGSSWWAQLREVQTF